MFLTGNVKYMKICIQCTLSYFNSSLFPKKSELAGSFEFTSHNWLTQFIQAHFKSPEPFLHHSLNNIFFYLMAVLFNRSYVKRQNILSGYFLKVKLREGKIEKIKRGSWKLFIMNYSTVYKALTNERKHFTRQREATIHLLI